MEWAEPIAYGALGLKPWEFEKLQPQEFYKLVEGYKWRKFQQECIFANFTAINVNPHLKKAISPLDILKKLNPAKIKELQKEQSIEDKKHIKAIFRKELDNINHTDRELVGKIRLAER